MNRRRRLFAIPSLVWTALACPTWGDVGSAAPAEAADPVLQVRRSINPLPPAEIPVPSDVPKTAMRQYKATRAKTPYDAREAYREGFVAEWQDVLAAFQSGQFDLGEFDLYAFTYGSFEPEFHARGRLDAVKACGAAVQQWIADGKGGAPDFYPAVTKRLRRSGVGLDLDTNRWPRGVFFHSETSTNKALIVSLLNQLEDVQEVRSSFYALDDEMLKAASRWKRLSMLDISSDEFSGTCFRGLEGLSALEVARFSCSGITDEVMPVIASWTNMAVIDVSFTHVTDAGIKLLSGCTKVVNFQCNHFPHSERTNWPPKVHNKTTDRTVDVLVTLTNIEFISLSGTAISDDGLTKLAKLPRLKRIDLDSTRITARGLKALAANPRITWLNLETMALDDAALTAIGEMKNLEWLNLINSRLAGGSSRHLANLARLKNLWLRGSNLPESEVALLRQRLPRCGIETRE